MEASSSMGDAESLKSWWTSLLTDEPPTAETRGLWFGLFESGDGTTFYVQGYPEFNADDETAEWATDEPSWAPSNRYLRLPSVIEAPDWQVALERALRLVEQLQPQAGWPGDLHGVAAGFDDGDAHLVWSRSSQG
jgi:hypothetical protein